MVDGAGWGRVEASGAHLDAVAATTRGLNHRFVARRRRPRDKASTVASTPGRSRARGPIEQYAIEQPQRRGHTRAVAACRVDGV